MRAHCKQTVVLWSTGPSDPSCPYSGYQLSGMAALHLLLLCAVLLQELPPAHAAEPFQSKREASGVLRRQKRHNSGFFEEFMEGNIERECHEEVCDLEEAREVFEDDEKTMNFWQSYLDGDQCKSSPCQNGGDCEDQMGAYICKCKMGYVGSDCEIELARQCDVDNGGCMHFCQEVGSHGAECYCATGYTLAEDGVTCQSEGDWSCGYDRRIVRLGGAVRTLLTNSTNTTMSPLNITAGTTDIMGVTDTITVTATNALPNSGSRGGRLMPSRSRLPMWVHQMQQSATAPPETHPPTTTTTTSAPLDTQPPTTTTAAPLDTQPPMINPADGENQHKRIVGGQEVTPGEIPWQVALVLRSTGEVFCGGSIVGEEWVVTAAHCLVDAPERSFFVRVGEHDVNRAEGHEQDLEVSKRYVHPLYVPARSTYNHDVALLRLAAPMAFSPYARPICLGPKAFTETLLRAGGEATVSGWGRMRFQGRTASRLQKVELPYVERLECKESTSERITYFMFCSGYADVGKDACQGDSGGPHTMRYKDTWFLTGIVSWGEECAKEGKYGVYTRISHYYSWMRYVMGLSREMLVDSVDP
ncbi:coagulation factor IXa [Sardina pilchardus]|uniref:coagulation factor IXa n=1 Tax=Sardina pilchardus TaxID=27697 RepID=UPI002E1642B0